MPGVERTECPLCLSSDIGRVVFKYTAPDKYELAIGVAKRGYRREMRSCGGCGSLVQSGGSGRIEEVYGEAYRSEGFRGETQSALFDRIVSLPREESENLARIDMLATDLGTLANPEAPLRMLDVGSGLGVFPWAVAVRFPHWRVATVDPDESSCRLLAVKAERARVEVTSEASFHRHGLFAGKPGFGAGRFDLVTLLHVLEHLRDPDKMIRQVAEDMEDEGLLYIEMPDALSTHLCGKDHDRFNSCHYFLPSERGLSQFLGRHGLESVVSRRVRTKRGMVNLTCLAARPPKAAGLTQAVLPK